MTKITTVMLVCLLTSAAAAQTSVDERNKRFREDLEAQSVTDTDRALKELLAQAKDKGTEDERRQAAEGVKGLLYNMAYIKYHCVTTTNAEREADACMKKFGDDLYIYSRLVVDYSAALAERSLQCEIQSRLYEAENEFPPFPIWKDAKLFDFARMNKCLRE